jgi:putative endonuclease
MLSMHRRERLPVIAGLVPAIQRAAYCRGQTVERPMRSYWVYMLASKPRGTLYIGVTNGIIRRVEQHREGKASSFTRRYKVHRLVWFQEFASVREAIQREKTMKEWPREWKINLIEQENQHWLDFYPSLPGVRAPSIKGASRGMDPGDKRRDDS